MPHPNRSTKGARTNPSTEEILRARTRADLTQEEAAAVIHGTGRAWQDYEGGQRNMHPGLFELFRIKTGQDKRYPIPEERVDGLSPSPPTPAQQAYTRRDGAIGKHGQIRFKFIDGLSCPFFICEICGQPLTEAGWTMIIWDMKKEGSGDYVIYPVHKRDANGRMCIRELEARIEKEGGSVGSIELRDLISQLGHNSGFKMPGSLLGRTGPAAGRQ